MFNLNDIHKAYFIGIGGIGMSALARYFAHCGIAVSGYDRTGTELTDKLQAEGIDIRFEENPNTLPLDVDLVVYTPAIPNTHSELNFYQQNGYQVVKRSQALGAVTRNKFTIAVAGSHGKTTVTGMIAHILHQSGYGCTAFVGGIMSNYGTNFIAGNEQIMLVEADEYDRSFLQLQPDVAVVTAIDSDHLEIYDSRQGVEEGFLAFANQLKSNGVLVLKAGLPIIGRLANKRVTQYHLSNTDADFYAHQISIIQNAYIFNVNSRFSHVSLNIGGRFNVENALAAIAVAEILNIDRRAISEALATFKGLKRRFEYVLHTPQISLIDDYAHHPEELRALITSARELHGDKKISIVFQPHLYSRTRDLAGEFAASLDLADEVMLLDIYPAREKPIEGVSSALIYEKLNTTEKLLISKRQLPATLRAKKCEVLLMAGAGDIDRLVQPTKQLFLQMIKKENSAIVDKNGIV